MNFSRYIGTLLIVFAFWGCYCNTAPKPNQKIVFQCSDLQLSTTQIQDLLVSVQSHLEGVAAQSITISKSSNGVFSISYFSKYKTDVIKNELFKANNSYLKRLAFKNTINNNTIGFNYEVLEIENTDTTGLGVNDSYVLPLKYESLRSFTPDINLDLHRFCSKLEQQVFRVHKKTHSGFVFIKKTHAKGITLVRAGPAFFNM